ncbi:MAG: hypothetical protein GEV03_24175 [Streptosporangiales bacterium]|nr:hypothetical protein [Streptosporangiales bacterium]
MTLGSGRRTAWLQAAMLVVGGVLLPLGLVVIVLGWYGAAHTPYLFEQNSYLISGGVFGLGLVVAGGFLFFGAWLARIAADNREAMHRLARGLDALAQTAGREAPGTLVATSKGSMVHRVDCPLVGEREDLHVVPVDGDGFQPCGVCQPPL